MNFQLAKCISYNDLYNIIGNELNKHSYFLMENGKKEVRKKLVEELVNCVYNVIVGIDNYVSYKNKIYSEYLDEYGKKKRLVDKFIFYMKRGIWLTNYDKFDRLIDDLPNLILREDCFAGDVMKMDEAFIKINGLSCRKTTDAEIYGYNLIIIDVIDQIVKIKKKKIDMVIDGYISL